MIKVFLGGLVLMPLLGCATTSSSAHEISDQSRNGYSFSAQGTIFLHEGRILFVRDRNANSTYVHWAKQPKTEDLERYYPANLSGGAYGVARCSVAGKRLVGCTSEYPTTVGYEAAFESLAAQFQLEDSAPSADRIDYVLVEMRLNDGGEWRPCPGAPFCVIEPPAPPAPRQPTDRISPESDQPHGLALDSG